MTDIGIIGSGRLGQAMARVAVRAGGSVVIANSRGPESLTALASALGEGVSTGTPADAAAAATVVLAVPWDRVPEAVNGLEWNSQVVVPWDRVPEAVNGLEWNSQVVIDATNDWAGDDLEGRTSSEIVAALVQGAPVVKAANTLSAEVLASDPHQADGRRVIFISGDDNGAKARVEALFEDAGFAVLDLGDLARGGELQQIHRPLAGINLIRIKE